MSPPNDDPPDNGASRLPRPWTLLSAEQETDYRILRVRNERWRNPRNDHEMPIVRVTCPDWVNVLAFTDDDQAILVRQFRFGTGGNTLEIAGGVIEPGEAPDHAARRELLEETGYLPRSLTRLGATHPNPAYQTNTCHLFLAEGCTRQSAPKQDEGEDVQVVLRPRAALDDLVRRGEITHALVLVTLLTAKLR